MSHTLVNQTTISREEACAVSMMNDLQLVRECWMRGLPYSDYVAFVQKHDRRALTEAEFNQQCASLEAQMREYFGV